MATLEEENCEMLVTVVIESDFGDHLRSLNESG